MHFRLPAHITQSPKAKNRGIKYVSGNTTILGASVNPSPLSSARSTRTFASFAQYYDVSSSSTLCSPNTDGSRTCTIYLDVPLASGQGSTTFDDFAFGIYGDSVDSSNSNGAVFTGTPTMLLATGNVYQHQVTTGSSNSINVTLFGIPASVSIAWCNLPGSNGFSNTIYPRAQAYDQSGWAIASDDFDYNPILLYISDHSPAGGSTSLSIYSFDQGATLEPATNSFVEWSNPNDTTGGNLSFTYDGMGVAVAATTSSPADGYYATITATYNGSQLPITEEYTAAGASGMASLPSQQTPGSVSSTSVYFNPVSVTQNAAASTSSAGNGNGSLTAFALNDGAAIGESDNCSGLATITAGTGDANSVPYTIASSSNTTIGSSCSATFTDATNGSATTATISITSTGVQITIPAAHAHHVI